MRRPPRRPGAVAAAARLQRGGSPGQGSQRAILAAMGVPFELAEARAADAPESLEETLMRRTEFKGAGMAALAVSEPRGSNSLPGDDRGRPRRGRPRRRRDGGGRALEARVRRAAQPRTRDGEGGDE